MFARWSVLQMRPQNPECSLVCPQAKKKKHSRGCCFQPLAQRWKQAIGTRCYLASSVWKVQRESERVLFAETTSAG